MGGVLLGLGRTIPNCQLINAIVGWRFKLSKRVVTIVVNARVAVQMVDARACQRAAL